MDEKRFPPGPCGPWPSVYPKHREDGVWPAWPRQWRNDTEPVIGVYPWENCCSGEQDPCMCITSAEVDRWDGVHDIVSANSAAWNDNSPHNEWETSADLWNTASEIVSGHSAYWDSAYSMAQRYDSGAFQDVQSFISATSAFLATYSAFAEVQTDDTLSGDGAKMPLGLSQSRRETIENLSKAANDLYDGGFWGEEEKRNWVGMDVIDELQKVLDSYADLFFDTDSAYVDRYGYVNKGVFPQLEKIWALLRDTEKWVLSESADLWNGASMTVKEHSGFWEENSREVDDHCQDWNTTVSIVKADSANWDSAYSAVINSADLWNTASTILSSHSAKWEKGDDSWKDSADLWQEASETVSANSAYWASGSHETWQYAPNMNAGNVELFNAPDTIYFNF